MADVCGETSESLVLVVLATPLPTARATSPFGSCDGASGRIRRVREGLAEGDSIGGSDKVRWVWIWRGVAMLLGKR